MNKSRNIRVSVFYLSAFLLFCCGSFSIATAQIPAEFAPGSMPPSGNGPLTTAQSGRFLLNPEGATFVTPNTTVSITGTTSNQQFTGVGTGPGDPVVMFGATNTTGTGPVTPRPTYATMNDVGSPLDTHFSNAPDGSATGIAVDTNLAFNLYTSVRHWADQVTPATNSRIYMADLTFTFSTPLTNPYMHVVGLGGTVGGLGFGTELEITTPGLTFTQLQGNSRLAVTSNEININGTGIGPSCSSDTAACGTIRINGSNIQSVTFKVYIRGDGGGPTWGETTLHAGDQWLVGFSLPETFTLSGNVFYDIDALNDGTVDGVGIGLSDGVQLYANLIEVISGKIMGSVPVNSDGTYVFNGIPAGASVRVEVSINQGTALELAPANAINADWFNTGENVGAGPGSDGTVDGAIALVVTGNVTNVNFGLKRSASTAAGVTIAGRVATATGRGISGARITLIDSFGNARFAATSHFGYYRFDDVRTGGSVVLHVSAKRFRFENPSRVHFLTEARDDLDFIGH